MSHEELQSAFAEYLEIRGEYLIGPMLEEGLLPQYPEDHVLREHRERYPEDPIHNGLLEFNRHMIRGHWGLWPEPCGYIDPPPAWCWPVVRHDDELRIDPDPELIGEISERYFEQLRENGLEVFEELIVAAPQNPVPF